MITYHPRVPQRQHASGSGAASLASASASAAGLATGSAAGAAIEAMTRQASTVKKRIVVIVIVSVTR